MIKGVNKKVIEINDTGNMYFEKAVLYVRSEMTDTPYSHLLREASCYLDESAPLHSFHKNNSSRLSKLSRAALFAAGTAVLAGFIIFFIIAGRI